jgi:hypothetical protein
MGSVIKFIKKIGGLEGAERCFVLYVYGWNEGLPLDRTTEFAKKEGASTPEASGG